MKYSEIFSTISNESFEIFSKTSQEIIEKIATDKKLIINMLNNVLEDERLIRKSECYDFLDKIICYEDEEKQMRISLFNDKYANRIHYHRWDYTAYILSGNYTQYFYGVHEKNDIKDLYPYEPIFVEKCLEGNMYSLSHKMVHSVEAKPDTISICIRGKAFEDRFQAIEPKTNTSWWQYGSKMEANEERIMKSVSCEYLKKKIDHIIEILR